MTVPKNKRSRPLRKEKEYSGKVIRERVSPGSKSERMAVQLDTGEEKFLLRRIGIRSYQDLELEALVGKTVTCRGVKRGKRLYVRGLEHVEQDGKP